LEELFEQEVVYSVETNEGTKMYKQEYKFESGKVEFVGDPVEVHRKVEYVANKLNVKLKKEVKVKGKECPACVEKINALIANKDSGFTEDDRGWMENLDENQLDKLTPKIVEKTVEVNKLTPEEKAALAYGQKQLKERHEAMMKTILDNTENVWSKEVLEKMDDEILEGISKSVKKEEIVDYSINAGSGIQTGEKVAVLLPIGVEVETDKK
jgi:hypothetical protein